MNERAVGCASKWQDRYVNAVTTFLHLCFLVAMGVFAFCLNLLRKEGMWENTSYKVGLFSLVVCVLSAIWTVIARAMEFKHNMNKAKAKVLAEVKVFQVEIIVWGDWKYLAFFIEVLAFAAGILGVFFALIGVNGS